MPWGRSEEPPIVRVQGGRSQAPLQRGRRPVGCCGVGDWRIGASRLHTRSTQSTPCAIRISHWKPCGVLHTGMPRAGPTPFPRPPSRHHAALSIAEGFALTTGELRMWEVRSTGATRLFTDGQAAPGWTVVGCLAWGTWGMAASQSPSCQLRSTWAAAMAESTGRPRSHSKQRIDLRKAREPLAPLLSPPCRPSHRLQAVAEPRWGVPTMLVRLVATRRVPQCASRAVGCSTAMHGSRVLAGRASDRCVPHKHHQCHTSTRIACLRAQRRQTSVHRQQAAAGLTNCDALRLTTTPNPVHRDPTEIPSRSIF